MRKYDEMTLEQRMGGIVDWLNGLDEKVKEEYRLSEDREAPLRDYKAWVNSREVSR